MSYTVPTNSVIDYPPEAMETFQVYGYEWIDNLHFIFPLCISLQIRRTTSLLPVSDSLTRAGMGMERSGSFGCHRLSSL